MKKLTLIIFALALATTAHAGWWQTFGGADTDIGYCVQQTSDGGYIVSGYTATLGGMWLLKLDSLGHTEWTKTYGEGGASSVYQTSDGGYVIGGSRLIKTDSQGETLWTREWGGHMQATSDNGYIVTSRQSNAVRLLRLNEDGDSIWARLYDKIGSYADVPNCVRQTSDGGYIITGLSDDVDIEQEVEKTSLFLIKTNASGDIQWIKKYGGEVWGEDYDWGNYVREIADGGYIIAGRTMNSIWLLKTDTLGDTLWTQTYGGGEGFCVQEISDGNYILTGEGPAENALSSFFPFGGDLWLLKIVPNGDTIWTRSYGGEETDLGRYVEQTSDGGYIVTGYTLSFGAGSEDLYLLKTDSLGLLGIKEEPISDEKSSWQLSSVIGSEITLRYSNCYNGFNAAIFDVSGRKVDEIRNHNQSGIITWGSGYSPGVYIIRSVSHSNTITTAKAVIVH